MSINKQDEVQSGGVRPFQTTFVGHQQTRPSRKCFDACVTGGKENG